MGAGLVRRRRARVRARARGRLLPAGREPSRVPQRRRHYRARDLRDRPQLPAVTVALGLDVGATKIAAARVELEHGGVIAARRLPTAPQRGSDAVLADCRALARELADGAVAVGLAVCELVDPHGRVRSAETVDWRATNLLGIFDGVESDVRAAARAEARF